MGAALRAEHDSAVPSTPACPYRCAHTDVPAHANTSPALSSQPPPELQQAPGVPQRATEASRVSPQLSSTWICPNLGRIRQSCCQAEPPKEERLFPPGAKALKRDIVSRMICCFSLTHTQVCLFSLAFLRGACYHPHSAIRSERYNQGKKGEKSGPVS